MREKARGHDGPMVRRSNNPLTSPPLTPGGQERLLISPLRRPELMRRKSSGRRQRIVLFCAALVALFAIAGFFVAPPIVKRQLESRLSAMLGRRVTVEKVALNPFTLAATLERFTIQEADGTTRFLGWERLHVNFDALASLRGEWVLSTVALDGFSARVAVNADQSFNFSDLLARFAPPARAVPAAPKSAPPTRPVRVASLAVSGAQLAFTDASRPQPFATTLGPLTFALTEFRTAGQRGAPYRFEAVTEAKERLAWSGTLQAEPPRSVGELVVENIVLAKYAPYYADLLRADLTGGTLSVRGGYELEAAGERPALRLKDGSVEVRGLRIVERVTQEPALELPELTVKGIQADALALKAGIATISVTGGQVRARREKDGSINLLSFLPPAPAAPGPAATPAPSPDVTIGEVAVKGFRVDVQDLAAPRPAQLALTDLEFAIKNVTLAEGATMPVQLAFAWLPKGGVRLDGTVGIAPVKADVKVDVAGFDLLPLSPYLEQFVNARVTQGAVTAKLEAQASLPAGGAPAVTAGGDVQVEKFWLVDSAHNEELAGVESVNVRGLRATTSPELGIALDEIAVVAPFIRVVVNADGAPNLASVLKSAAPAADGRTEETRPIVVPGTTAAAAAPRVEIGRITIRDGDTWFTDRSITPNVSMAVSQFGGEIAGLSSTQPGKGTVNLKALVDGSGPIAITGALDPLGARPSVNLGIDFKNVDLVPLSPYSARFAGYELARGKLVLDVKLKVDGPRIDSANVITLNQFTFGPPSKSPDATALPVRLGVALLKDIDGRIVIDVPVQGSLEDPSFRVGRVVLRVITNLLTKAAVSPFTLLGAAFGGGGDELAFQEFTPGSSELQPGEIRKLQTMVQALANRPGLSLGLEGSYDRAADTYALKRVKLADQVRRAIWEKKHQSNPAIPPPGELVISGEENVAMLKELYDTKFPPGTQFGAAVPPPPTVIVPPPPPTGGIFQRFVRMVTGQARKEQLAAQQVQQENARLAAEHARAVATAIAAGVPYEEMSARLADAITIGDSDLRELALARARRVRDYFATTGSIAADRLFLATEKAEPGAATDAGKGPRVFLSLQ